MFQKVSWIIYGHSPQAFLSLGGGLIGGHLSPRSGVRKGILCLNREKLCPFFWEEAILGPFYGIFLSPGPGNMPL